MTVQAKPTDVAVSDLISVFIDGTEVQVPKGTLAIRAAEKIGVAIPRFCDHPLLDPVGACRQCLVEVPDAGNGRGFPKPQASCTLEVAPGMKINTQLSSSVAEKAQRGMLELLLINHPLDCPICDKGGECPLQNQAMSNGRGSSRYHGVKRTFPKPVSISAQILLDRERCVLCARCTRFSEQISGDPFIALVERGALQQVGFYEDHPYNSYFSGNVVQICPVGALTSAAYRFQSRPFDLVSVPTTCEHCAAGCQLRSDQRHFQVKRRLAGDAPEVNEEWNCDKGRFAFVSGRGDDRITRPLVRRDGKLRIASWPEAIDAAVAGLKKAGTSVGVLTGGRLTLEAAYGYAKFARAVLGTNNVDFRSRPHSDEESAFLASRIAGRVVGDGVTYAELEQAKQVVTVCFEPEDESPIVFLRLRKAVRKNKAAVYVVGSLLSAGSRKLNATLIPSVPGAEAQAVRQLDAGPDMVILVGERAATSPGTLSALASLAERSGARVAWIPRRAGDRGALEAGCLPNLLPGGRPTYLSAARVDLQAAWEIDSLPTEAGLAADAMFAAAAQGSLKALVLAGLEPSDFASAAAVRSGLEAADFVISLETRQSEVTERADVVFPVALIEEHPGTFLNWEHRRGRVNTVIEQNTSPMTDLRVVAALADAMGKPLGFRTAKGALAEFDELGVWEGAREVLTPVTGNPITAGPDQVSLATWRELIDGSRGNDGEPALLATARTVVAKLSPATAAEVGVGTGEALTVEGEHGWLTMITEVVDGMVDRVVWVPTNAPGTPLGELGLVAGMPVELSVPAEDSDSEGGAA